MSDRPPRPIPDVDVHREMERLARELHRQDEELERLREYISTLRNWTVREIERILKLLHEHPHPHPRPAVSATLVGHRLSTFDERNTPMAEIGDTGEAIAVVALAADGQPTTDDINGPTLVVNDPSGVFVWTDNGDGLGGTLVPNAGVYGEASVTWNATDVNGAPILDPSTGAAPVYVGTRTAPARPAVSATLEGTPL